MESVKLITFQTQLEAFCFLGVETPLHDGTDFAVIWDSFFQKGGYSCIDPFAADPSCMNVWHSSGGQAVYFQGKTVREGAALAPGYSLKRFPACEYLVVTTEWLPTCEASMQHINHDYYRSAPVPDGYRVHPESEDGVFLMERWGEQTKDGFRYEFWLPIEKI